MYFDPILLAEPKARGENQTPIGVFVIYETDDHEEMEHLLLFLEHYCKVPEEEITQKNKRKGLRAYHPYFQLGDTEVSLPYLLSRVAELENLEMNSVAGFFYPGNSTKRRSHDIETFRAYKKHLDVTGKEWVDLRNMYQAIEDKYFPLGKKLN